MSPSPLPATVTEAARAISDGALSPTELVQACLDRIEEVEPVIRAFAEIDGEGALAQARVLTEEVAHGRVRGPLHGIPMGIKDLIDAEPFATRAGSRVLEGDAPPRDAPVIERLRRQGAVILGKTQTHEFAYGVTTPPTRNPWDPERIAGGSSGGSAAAVAAGECVAALGTDTGGSIRVPAALCGISGLRPLVGEVPTEGTIPFSSRMDTCGPMARSAEDLRVLLEAMTGEPYELDPSSSGMRIGVVGDDALDEADRDVLQALEDACAELSRAGASVRRLQVPPLKAWDGPRSVVVMHDFLSVHRDRGWYPALEDRYGSDIRSILERAGSITPEELREATAGLAVLERQMRQAIEDIDLLVLPTTSIPAPEAAQGDAVDETG
ncbi:MAG: amidase, partial [Candidatus Velamenicoccus archaeovorus]